MPRWHAPAHAHFAKKSSLSFSYFRPSITPLKVDNLFSFIPKIMQRHFHIFGSKKIPKNLLHWPSLLGILEKYKTTPTRPASQGVGWNAAFRCMIHVLRCGLAQRKKEREGSCQKLTGHTKLGIPVPPNCMSK